ncbi:hypothetical protein HU200_022069 [Digitaria exilis]|uniref:Cytochrome P450 n=1 Tax=Digitaria exilis TaxID=1010633 RepID=A0A835C758_9POAL|nr:hypothetical protein HU200_022069 [Digitaria exilis]
MEDRKTVLAVAVAVLIIVLISKLKSLLISKPKLNLPPGPWTLPVIGSIHHLVTSPVICRGMRDLSQKHGPLMMLRLGEVPTVVVSSPEAAQAITKTHDITPTLAVLTYNGTNLAFAPYGERWRQLRKIWALELLSLARVQSFRRIREEEPRRVRAVAGAAVNLTKMISKLINETFYQDEYLDALDTAVRQTSGLTAADLFPSSRVMRALSSAPRKVLECRKRIERILEQIIEEKRQALDSGDEAAHEGLLGVLLRLQKEGNTPIPLTNHTLFVLIDTSSTTLTWCMTELIRNPASMAKAQAEVREALKGKSTITEDDITGLSYLKLVIREALRLHCPLPLLLPRQCREACQVMGYDMPKGTSVLINAWAICRDPKYWDKGEEFKPERFEKSNMDYKGTNYEFLPFGSGRRMCPGVNLGLANIELALASLLYHFDWELPNRMEPKDVQTSEASGVVGKKDTDLILHPVWSSPHVCSVKHMAKVWSLPSTQQSRTPVNTRDKATSRHAPSLAIEWCIPINVAVGTPGRFAGEDGDRSLSAVSADLALGLFTFLSTNSGAFLNGLSRVKKIPSADCTRKLKVESDNTWNQRVFPHTCGDERVSLGSAQFLHT